MGNILWYDRLPEKQEHYDGFILTRHHAFSRFHLSGLTGAIAVLDERRLKNEITDDQRLGLLAELLFYGRFKSEYCLTPTLDCGDHKDFVGMINGSVVGIDVTTNVSNKIDLCAADQVCCGLHYVACVNRTYVLSSDRKSLSESDQSVAFYKVKSVGLEESFRRCMEWDDIPM